MSKHRESDAVLLITAVVMVVLGLAADVPALVFIAVGGWLAYYVYSRRKPDRRTTT